MFSCTDKCRKIFALPPREGGLAIYNVTESADLEYSNSCKVTAVLTEAIYNQDTDFFEDAAALYKIKQEVTRERKQFYEQKRAELVETLTDSERLQLDLASEKGASSWLTSLPLQSFGFLLNKQEFTDALSLRYNLKIKDTHKLCVCGEENTINHCLTCKLGGYVCLRHNSLRDTTAKLMRKTCNYRCGN